MAHKYDHQTISTVNSTIPKKPKNGTFVQAGLLVQDSIGGGFEVADGTKPILGVVIGLEGTLNSVGTYQSIAVQSEEITCQVDGEYSSGQVAYSTIDGKATASDANLESAFGIFSNPKNGNIGFIRRL